MKQSSSAGWRLFLCTLLAIWSFLVISCADTAEKKVMGVVVITHGAPIPQWNETVMRVISTVKSPYPIEPAFMDFDEERTLAKAAKTA